MLAVLDEPGTGTRLDAVLRGLEVDVEPEREVLRAAELQAGVVVLGLEAGLGSLCSHMAAAARTLFTLDDVDGEVLKVTLPVRGFGVIFRPRPFSPVLVGLVAVPSADVVSRSRSISSPASKSMLECLGEGDAMVWKRVVCESVVVEDTQNGRGSCPAVGLCDRRIKRIWVVAGSRS